MVRVTNISHRVVNATGRVEKRRVTVRGRLLTPGSHTTFAELPQEIEGLLHDPVRNPSGFLATEEIPAVAPRKAAPAPAVPAAPAGPDAPHGGRTPGSEEDAENRDAAGEGVREDTARGQDPASPDPSLGGEEGAAVTPSREADDGAESRDPEGAEGTPSGTPAGGPAGSPAGASLDVTVSAMAAELARLDTVEAVQAFVRGDGRATVIRAAERRLRELQPGDAPE